MAEYIDRKDAIISDLIACKAAFNQAGVPWIIIGGIVLGYARYKDIMRWDTDLDMGVFVKISLDQWRVLHNALGKNGFNLPITRENFMCCIREAEFNLWFFNKNDEFYEAFPECTPGIKFVEKAIWYDEPQMVDFLGDKYPMPNNLEDYLVCQYGADWKTNIVKNHEEYYLEKRGTRNVAAWPAGRATKEGDMWPKTLKIEDNM